MSFIPGKAKIAYWYTWAVAAFVAALSLPAFHGVSKTQVSFYEVNLNGQVMGRVDTKEEAECYLREARRALYRDVTSASGNENGGSSDSGLVHISFSGAGASEFLGGRVGTARITRETPKVNLTYAEANMTYTENYDLVGYASPKKEVVSAMEQVLKDSVTSQKQVAYTMKINHYIVTLASVDDVEEVLQAALDKYDISHSFEAELVSDNSSQLNVLTAGVTSRVEKLTETMEANKISYSAAELPGAGLFEAFKSAEEEGEETAANANRDFGDFELGLINMEFEDPIEVVQTYVPASVIEDTQAAIEEVTKDQATNQIYEVKSGDTLSEISEKFDMTIEDLVAMNTILESGNSVIRVGDELTISIPEPELAVIRVEEKCYEEYYDAPIEYVYNDEWYSNQTKTLQQPSSGHRKVVALVTYRNDNVAETDIIKESVGTQAVPKIVEKGTKIPPTYIWPVSGGRISSGFGYRKKPNAKGATAYHQGLDIAVPTGTAVMASCGGTVIKAGWNGGYGNLVCIRHPDGRETRYAHLSKILVSVGQSVSQGQKIALSGNTGASTGPHLHFEIRIGGSPYNPLNYLSY